MNGVPEFDFILIMSIVTVSSFGLCCGLLTANLSDSNRELELQATTDSMTGLANRSFFNGELIKQISAARRYKTKLSVVMCDLDHFKKINDTYGHAVGDQVIIEFANELVTWTRNCDLCSRFGGEEFLILLPQAKLEQAKILAERICNATSELKISSAKGDVVITASFGVAEFHNDIDHEALLKKVDDALYKAKAAGRNCIKAYSESS